MVIVDVEEPFAATGPVPVIEEKAALAAVENTTVPPDEATGVAIDSVFVSAFDDFKVQVEIPEAFELEQAP